jgi:CRISPR-associated protein Cas5t
MDALSLFVDVPICAFRPNWSREYQDSYVFPPPATVYGMLLSLVGVDWAEKEKYAGVQLALALQHEPEKSRVYRKFRRVGQSSNADPLTARRPDYQDLLLWLKLWIWLRDGNANESLINSVTIALDPQRRHRISRFGGLSLGESTHLVNEISLFSPARDCNGRFLEHDPNGYFTFPIWVHHPRCGKGRSLLGRFSITEPEPLVKPVMNDARWIEIRPPSKN